eukprot:m.78550 g.78550  ORF g.78550 m.78550 type:complete len:413 (-) comp25126_c0_seq1:152-1390(-)
MDRLKTVLSHLSQRPCKGSSPVSDDDIVIISALRTPIGRARKGQFAVTPADNLLATALKAVIDESGIDAALIEDIHVGNVLMDNFAVNARTAQFLAGIPETTSITTTNRQCSSGLQAVINIANEIKSGMIDIGIGAGVESMSSKGMGDASIKLSESIFENDLAQDCLIPMGITSENVAAEFGISRATQDAFAEASHKKAAQAQANGWFKAEIVSTPAFQKDADGDVDYDEVKMCDQDDGVRPTTTVAALAKLKPAFKAGGSTTAGNSSQTSDGAAAVLMMKRSTAKKLGMKVLATLRTYAVAGVAPHIMGIGPAVAIPKALSKAGLTVDDIDVFEINEAFASQATYCANLLKIPTEKLNPKGGAIAFGHPLGCTGARQTATLCHELQRRGGGKGVVSMCIGTGMGLAAVFEV